MILRFAARTTCRVAVSSPYTPQKYPCSPANLPVYVPVVLLISLHPDAVCFDEFS